MATKTIRAITNGLSNDGGSASNLNGGVAGKDSSNTGSSYTQVSIGRSSGNYIYLSFDLSSIPAGSTIDSVTCNARIALAATMAHADAALYSGTVKKTSDVYVSQTSSKVYTVSGGSWTRDEILSCRFGVYCFSSSSTASNRKITFYGADISVVYTYQERKFMLKLGGAWHDIARVFKKVSGIWVEQTDLANVIEDGVRYQNGGEIESTAPQTKTVTISGSGMTSDTTVECYVEINGVKYTSATTIEVQPGTTVRCYGYGGTVNITLNGAQVGTAVGGNSSKKEYSHAVNEDCTVALSYTTGFTASATIAITTGGSGGANLISFTIDGTSYQAQEGMTWEQWVASSYNTGGFKVSSNYGNYYIAASTGVYLKNPEGYILLSTAVIISGGAYTLN